MVVINDQRARISAYHTFACLLGDPYALLLVRTHTRHTAVQLTIRTAARTAPAIKPRKGLFVRRKVLCI